jgi:hypothetical protein
VVKRGRAPPDPVAREHALYDLIYGAAVEPELWPSVLEGVSDLLHAGAINLTRLSIEDGGGDGFACRADPGRMDAYFAYYAALNPLTTATAQDGPEGWAPTVYTDEQALDREQYVRSEYFNDHIVPAGGDWSMVIRLGRADRQVSTIMVGRTARRGRFEASELAAARRVQPHLIRALRVATRLEEAHARSAGHLAALDHARDPMS